MLPEILESIFFSAIRVPRRRFYKKNSRFFEMSLMTFCWESSRHSENTDHTAFKVSKKNKTRGGCFQHHDIFLMFDSYPLIFRTKSLKQRPQKLLVPNFLPLLVAPPLVFSWGFFFTPRRFFLLLAKTWGQNSGKFHLSLEISKMSTSCFTPFYTSRGPFSIFHWLL